MAPFGEGAMTDALNVSITENGSQTEGIIKAVKGTIAATAKDAVPDNECRGTHCNGMYRPF